MKLDGNSGWNAVIGTQPSEKFSVKINYFVDGHYIMIGMASLNNFDCNARNCDNNGYFLHFRTGCLYDKKLKSLYCPPIKVGTIVTMILIQNEIRYIIDGKDCGVAFSNVTEQLYPAIAMAENASITLVED